MKKLVPVRLLKNQFFDRIAELEKQNATIEKLSAALGKGRAKLGMLDGNMEEGELEVGQISGLISDIPSVSELISTLRLEFSARNKALSF